MLINYNRKLTFGGTLRVISEKNVINVSVIRQIFTKLKLKKKKNIKGNNII